jgi:WhiB family transcriptional regulator, redox-sensing transcriptional regulator
VTRVVVDRSRGEWVRSAACAGMDPEWWFADRGTAAARRAMQVCAGCPVLLECAAWAAAIGADWGIWGGRHRSARDTRPPPPLKPQRLVACAVCGGLFYTNRPQARYCGERCAVEGARRADLERRRR